MYVCMYVCVCELLSHVQLFAASWTVVSVHGTLQARILEWVAISSRPIG